MKLSEQIEIEASMEENDSKAFALHAKARRQSKKEDFEEDILPDIERSSMVSCVKNFGHFYQIFLKDGTKYDYYPMRDRLMKHRPTKWFFNGKKILVGLIVEPITIELHDPKLPGVVIFDQANQ